MIQIGFLTEEALDEVLALERICFPDDPWSRMSFENELTNPLSVFLTATDDATGSVIGYGGVWLMYDAGNITNIAIHPDYRREGIAARLLTLLTDICMDKGMETITLEVRESNLPARKLYETSGFSVCGLRKKYYQGKEDALIMTKELLEEKESDYANISN
ncbi:MAG: ribosomal protein S18-alanine N-acetyltransferase [Clostridia bacterium]|nr:ribosomal protein S18-alanine N-acetyltransferase [Clostridia bacterium]